MNRREAVLMLVGMGVAATPPFARAQAAKMRRIGILMPNAAPALNGAFRKRLATLGWIEGPSIPAQNMFELIDAAAAKHGASVLKLRAQTVEEVEAAFAVAARERAAAVVVLPASLFVANGKLIVTLSRKHRIATAHQNRQAVAYGALVSYGIDFVDGFARTAVYVDKILKGAKPGDLPVEQAERFVLAVNRSTAKAFGITIPQSVLVRADEVIE